MPDLPVAANPLHVLFGEFEVDEANALLLASNRAIALSPTPFRLLCALLRRPGALLTKHALLDEVWGHRFVSDSVLKGAISDIRRVLADDPREPRYVQTVPRRGYRFIGTPETLHGATPSTVRNAEATTGSSGAFEVETQPSSFVGRAAELARLLGIWQRAERGRRAIAWVAGEPGIGKTTLIEQFVSSLGSVACARGQSVQHHGTGEPYLPVLEALADLCRRDPGAVVLLRDVAPTWLLQIPWLLSVEQRDALLHELVGANPQRMLREMGEFMDRYSEQQPILLVTEDLHWADHATLELVNYVARRRTNSRLLWLSSFRLTELIALDHPLNTLRHELRAQGLCDEIVLDSFSEADVAAYVAQRSPSMATDDQFVRALHERTGGVPLFVASIAGEVIGHATTHGPAEAARLASTMVPDNLGALIDHYAARLARERRALLVAAAVCGTELRIDTLAGVLERDTVAIAEDCHELARERLWLAAAPFADGRDGAQHAYSFRHALFRERLYHNTSAPARVALHRKVGVVLEAQRAAGATIAAVDLAMHFDLGLEPATALRYYAEAARATLLALSPAQCMNVTERALALADQVAVGPDRRSAEIALATLRGVASFHTLGAGAEAKAAYLRAATLLTDEPTHPMAGLALHGLGFLLCLRGEYAPALATAARARSLAQASEDPMLALAACAVEGQVLVMQGRHQAAREALERALPALERASTTTEQRFIGFIADPQVTVLALLSLPLAHLGLLVQAQQRLQQAYARARRIGQPMALMLTVWFDALFEIRRNDAGRVAELATEMRALVDEFALVQGGTACRWFAGWAEVRAGEALAGFRRIREAFEENCDLGMVSGGSETLGYAAEALVLHGDGGRARQQLEQALDIANTCGERIFLPQLLLTRASIERSRGDPEAARASIRQAIAEARSQGASWFELLALTELCECGLASPEDRRALAALVDRLVEARDTRLFARARALAAGTGSA